MSTLLEAVRGEIAECEAKLIDLRAIEERLVARAEHPEMVGMTSGKRVGAVARKVTALLATEEPLTEPEIVRELRRRGHCVAHDDVAEACGRLLAAGKVELLEDGGYGIAEVAA